MSGKRIILATIGAMGGLHPYTAIALGLQSRGHSPVIATRKWRRTG
jgi:UDP:flavonoid glycosyltransferase YjiC (YdhE family)